MKTDARGVILYVTGQVYTQQPNVRKVQHNTIMTQFPTPAVEVGMYLRSRASSYLESRVH